MFVVGPPLRPATRPDSPPGRGSQMSQNLFKNILFDQISMCCWPRILAQIDPNRSFFTLVPPPCGQQYVVIRLRAGVSNCLKICSRKTLLEQLSVCCWPRMFVKIAPNRSAFTFGPPPSGHQYVEIRLRGRGGQTSQNLCKNSLFEQISMCCWPRIFVKIDPNRSFFLLGGLAGAPVWPEFHRSGLLGCMTAAEL